MEPAEVNAIADFVDQGSVRDEVRCPVAGGLYRS